MSLSNYLEDKLVDHVCGGASFTQPAARYAKLHIGDPGEAGTANAAGETTRKAMTFGASSSGTATQTGTASWTSVSTAETINYISLWDASTAGNCLGASNVIATPRTVAIGDNLDLTGVTFAID